MMAPNQVTIQVTIVRRRGLDAWRALARSYLAHYRLLRERGIDLVRSAAAAYRLSLSGLSIMGKTYWLTPAALARLWRI